MKIALIVHDLHDHGGHSRYTRVLAEELSRSHEVAVFANRCEQPADALWQSHHVRAWRSSALATVQTFPLGLRAHSKQLADYDIRHGQGYCGGNPNLVTAHICVAAYLDSLRDISARNRASLKLMAAAEERFYRRYDGRVIAISQKIAGEVRDRYRVRGPIAVVPHGVDASRFDSLNRHSHRSALRQQWGINESQTVALYAGDLTKAHVQLKALTEKAPDVQFVIVSGSTRYLWSAPNVKFLPPTNELERYYAAADAFVFPTTYDAFGMVVLEAMASGLPVFCSDQAGVAELIESGRDGFVIPLNDWVDETAAALSNRDPLQSIGRKAEETARRHDWQSVVREVERLYFLTVAEAGPLGARASRPQPGSSLDHGNVSARTPSPFVRGKNGEGLSAQLDPPLNPLPKGGEETNLPRVAFVVSGDRDSAMGFRARSMAAKLASHFDIQIAYRSQRKIVSIFSVFNFLVRRRPATIYLFDISYTGVLAAGCYKLIFNSRMIIETGDAIAELVRSTGSRGRLGIWLTKRLENLAFALADRVVVRGTFHKELLRERGIDADVIQDGVETNDFAADDGNELRRKFDLKGVTTFGLVGSSIWSEKLGMCYGWELVETLRLLKDKRVKGVMIGDGTGIPHLKARSREYGLEEKIIFLGHVPYEQLPAYLQLIDICFSTQTNDVVGQVRTTGKLPLYLAAGRFILASRVGEAARVLPEEMLVEYAGVSDPEYPRKLQERIENILAHPEMLKRATGNIALAKEHFDYAILAERLKEVISATIQSEPITSAVDGATSVPAKSVTTR